MKKVSIIEVGPRDGLQNEAITVSTQDKALFIQNLVNAGLKEIEATSFVSPKHVPQLGDAAELWKLLPSGALFSALVPNRKGLERALECGVRRIAVFTAASNSFTQKNIGMTVEQSLNEFRALVSEFRSQCDGFVRGYVSTAFECPYEGRIEPDQVQKVVESLLEMGVDEISLGDTIGVAAPIEVARLTEQILKVMPVEKLDYHFHDTRGTAIANVAEALRWGVTRFDSSAGGLGGCPYAPGAGGNLATEDLVYFLERSGYETGVDLKALAHASASVVEILGRAPASKVQLAVLSHS